MIEYKRAYYFSEQEGDGGNFPLDAKLGIDRRHTPGCQYFLSSFTGREAYQKSLERLRQQEIKEVFEGKQAMAKENSIKDVTVVSVDATKLRQKGQQQLRADGRKSWPTVWRDVKVGAVSSIGWDEKRQEAVCSASCYDSGIEHADLSFKRLTVEVLRRAKDLKRVHVVFLADGANWIWDRFAEIAPEHSTRILDFYHACEHVSYVCKRLHDEETPVYWKSFNRWKAILFAGKVRKFLQELQQIRDAREHRAHRDFIQGEINYFTDNKQRMSYDIYRAARLPIGSGTIESACKNVIGGRMEQGGMTWSEAGAEGMLQIRSAIESGRHFQDFLATLDQAA